MIERDVDDHRVRGGRFDGLDIAIAGPVGESEEEGVEAPVGGRSRIGRLEDGSGSARYRFAGELTRPGQLQAQLLVGCDQPDELGSGVPAGSRDADAVGLRHRRNPT